MEQPKDNAEQMAHREWLVENLRLQGSESLEVKEKLVEWIKGEEAKREDGFDSVIPVLIEHALLCKDAGLLADANDLLEAAYLNAYQLGDLPTCISIDGIIDSL